MTAFCRAESDKREAWRSICIAAIAGTAKGDFSGHVLFIHPILGLKTA